MKHIGQFGVCQKQRYSSRGTFKLSIFVKSISSTIPLNNAVVFTRIGNMEMDKNNCNFLILQQ